MKKFKAILVLIIAVIFLAACGTSNETEEAASTQVLDVQTIEELQTIDTNHATGNIATFTANMNVFNGLMTYNLDHQLAPADAEAEPEVSEDGLVYTFKIREDANWSNGDPVTAHDYVYSWQKMVDPNTAASYAYMYDGLVENATEIMNSEAEPTELGVTAIDDKTFEVTLEQPTSYFLDLITIPAFYPQNQAVVEAAENYGTISDEVVFNGPFTLTNWNGSEGGDWTYVKNENYWDSENVFLDEINFTYLPETTTAVNLYESDQLDIIELSGNFAVEYNAHSDYTTYPIPRTNYLEMNANAEGLDNVHIRKALFQAVDRDDFVDNVLQNGSRSLKGQIPYEFAYHPETGADFRDDNEISTEFDPESAQEEWQTGLDELGVDELSYELLVMDNEDSQNLAEYLQGQLTETLPGLNITIRNVPSQQLFASLADGNFEIGLTMWQADFGDPINFLERFHTDINRGDHSVPEVDELIELSNEQANEPVERFETLQEIEQLAINEHFLHIPIYHSYQSLLEKSDITDVNRPGQSFTNYRWAKVGQTETE